jgi:uncharacterized YigZ family protein
MASFSYLTIKAPSGGQYKEKGSKFLAFAFPVKSEEEIKKHLKILRKEYFDARHHGYAFILGPDKEKYRAVDDGEPSHSTGDPILGQLRSRNLTNVLVVVVRYFGGTKLGVGGLIAAYRAAADQALSNAVVVEKDVTANIKLRYAYDATPAVQRLVKEFDLGILEQNFQEECQMSVEIKLQKRGEFMDRIKLLIALGTCIELTHD